MAKELLKEAIADAKAVREVALENAKMALEEAFDSKIKNMLSAKLAEEIEEDLELEETYMEDEKDEDMKEAYHEDEKDEDMKEAYHEDEKDEDMKEEFDLEEDEEINLEELMAELDEMSYDEDADEDMKEGKDDEKDEDMKEGKDDEKDEDMKEGELNESVEALLAALPAIGITAVAASGYGLTSKLKAAKGAKAKMEVMSDFLEAMGTGAGGGISGGGRAEESVDFDIDALISEIEADLAEETVDEGATGYDEKVGGSGRTGYDEKVGGKGRTGYDGAVKKLKEERDEALETVESLKSTISEMNLLNSKLLYCNKLFRANALTEAQKVKVVDALDKSTTTGEAKLVFETLQESFNFTGVEKRAIKEGLGRASKAAGTAPKKVITESVDETVSRFQKLANINK
jgi:hypothetical protein